MLSDHDVERIVRGVVAAIATPPPPPRDVLNLDEAIAFVGKAHLRAPVKAFTRWRRRHGVRHCGSPGRYSLRSLKAALEREQRRTA